MGILYNAPDVIVCFTALLIYIFALVGFNEVARSNLKNGIIAFVVFPLLLAIFVWPKTADGSVLDWFNIAKLIAILSFAWIILALRYSERIQKISWFKYLVPLFLAINMLEAIFKDFELSTLDPGVYGEIYRVGGGWNIANGIAGLINVALICGFVGIYISKDKEKTMVWPDMIFWWILAYDFWNFSFIYNNGGGRSFYMAGALIAAMIATHTFKRGAWMQHRVFTLVTNQMVLWTVPAVFVTSSIAVESTWNPTVSWTVALISLFTNLGLLVYQGYIMYTKKRNSVKGEVFYDSKEYLETIEEEPIDIRL